MNTKLDKLKTAFSKLFFELEKDEPVNGVETVEVAFQSAKIKDSDSMIEFPALEVDAEVKISTATGSEVAPDGEYTIEDGSIISVSNGKIAEIKNAPEAEKPEELAEAPVAEVPAEDDKLKALEAKVNELENLIKTVTEAMSAVPSKEDLAQFKNEMGEVVTAVNEQVELLSKVPTELSSDRRVEVQESEMEKFNKILDRLKK